MDKRPIGFFDSGVGGISVLKEALRQLPDEQFLFVGDNRNAPYGMKSIDQINECVNILVERMQQRGIKALVIACNTATAASAKDLRERLSIPVIGMEPALKPAHALRLKGQILVLATPATLHMEKFRILMERYGEGAIPVEGYGIVECVEAGHINDKEIENVLHSLLDKHLKKPTDAIVLGCTHYVFIREALSRIAPDVPLIDGNEGTVRQLKRVLTENELLSDGPGGVELHSTGDERIYLPMMKKLLTL